MRRDAGIDIVRTLGILAIVAGHIWFTDLAYLGLYPWHVPVFFFLTGYLWKPKGLTVDLRNRAGSLLRPYAFWFAIVYAVYAAWVVVRGQASLGALAAPIYGGFYATRPFTTFWFVFVLFAAATVWRLLERTPSWLRWTLVGGATLAAPVVGPMLARTPLAIGTALLAFVFIAAGQTAREHESKLGPTRPYAAIFLLIMSGVLVFTGLSRPVNLKLGDWGTPVVSVVVACAISWSMVILATLVARLIGERSRAAFTTFALCGFTIVLVHPAVLWVLEPIPVPDLLLWVVAVCVPAVIGWVALRTPLSQWVTGGKKTQVSR